MGSPELFQRLDWVADTQGDGAGFDILSFDDAANNRFIEVKTTNGSLGSSFLVSHNELEFSKEAGEQFYLYRVFQFRDSPRLFTLNGDLSQHVYLKPTDFRASFRGEPLIFVQAFTDSLAISFEHLSVFFGEDERNNFPIHSLVTLGGS